MSFNELKRREFITLLGGAAATWPLAARAQQPARVPRIGVLMPLAETDPEGQARQAAFEEGLRGAGYVKGQNVVIEFNWVAAQYDRLPALAANLVRGQMAVIVTPGSAPAALAAQAATKTIPIVFSTNGDPVRMGLVASLNRPGGNLTGVSYLNNELGAKRLELLREMVRSVDLVAVLMNPASPASETDMREVEAAARAVGQKIRVLRVDGGRDIETAFAALVEQRAGAVLVVASNVFSVGRDLLIKLAAQHAIPAIYTSREFVEGGGLMSYGASLTDAYRLVGLYTGRILKGEKPADLPVQQSTKIDLLINLKTAKALGLTVPPNLLAIADEVIE
jgi:putative tryptophan/tyrosine transport system substrate-binding protein